MSEFDTWDLSAVLGQSADSCTTYVGNALELRHRLPRLWQRVLDLQVPVWRAFRITARTQCLPPEGVADVDRALAHCAHAVTLGQVDRTIAVALATHDPAEAEDRRKRADEAPASTSTSPTTRSCSAGPSRSTASSTSLTPSTSTPPSPRPPPSSPTSATTTR
ncbi:hypothetical protein [Nocardioides rubriscoriae]|uniref:hypothetical protein n=1 Tax=Nocardioides rubriscoriae TaxID=642762 RepID=UPI0011DF65D7|nr:hypothetical protein [Nocardioides rubriscoriae]